MLPLTFANPADYDKVQPSDRVSLLDLANLSPGKVSVDYIELSSGVCVCLCEQPVRCVLKHSDGSVDEIQLDHTMNEAQISWFKAGSALNKMADIFKK